MVNIILDDEFVTSRDGGFRCFLVKWHGHPDSDATWIHEDDLCHLDLLCWVATFPLTLRSQVLFNPEGMMGHRVGPYLDLDEIG